MSSGGDDADYEEEILDILNSQSKNHSQTAVKRINRVITLLGTIEDVERRSILAKAMLKFAETQEPALMVTLFKLVTSPSVLVSILRNENMEDDLVIEYKPGIRGAGKYVFEEADDDELYLDNYLLVIASEKGNKDLVEAVIETGMKDDELIKVAMEEAAGKGYSEIVRYLHSKLSPAGHSSGKQRIANAAVQGYGHEYTDKGKRNTILADLGYEYNKNYPGTARPKTQGGGARRKSQHRSRLSRRRRVTRKA